MRYLVEFSFIFSPVPTSSLLSVLSLCCYNFVMFEGMCDVDFSLFHCCVSLLHNLPCFRLFSLSTILTFFYFSLCRHFIQRQLNLIYLVRCIPCVVCLWWKCCFLFPLYIRPLFKRRKSCYNKIWSTHTQTQNAHWNALESIWLIDRRCAEISCIFIITDVEGRMHFTNPFLNFVLCFACIKLYSIRVSRINEKRDIFKY